MRKFVVLVSVVAALMAGAAQAQALEQTVRAPSPGATDNFGRAVALEGDTLVIGAPNADNNAGAVFVFKRTGDNWAFNAKLTASDAAGGANGDQLGTSVAIDGDKIVAGAPFDDVGAELNQGSAYVFDTTGANPRTQVARLFSSNGVGNNQFGTAVAIDGDTIVVGGPNVTTNVASEGTVYTFTRTGTTPRTETARLVDSGNQVGARLGSSVAIDGDKIVAGAPGASSNVAIDTGLALTFSRTGANPRVQNGELSASDGAQNDRLGASVDIEGDTIVVGADQDDIATNTDQGSAYTFSRTGLASRPETAKLTASAGAPNGRLGASIAINDTKIVSGAFGDTGAGVNFGAAYEFASTGATRNQTLKRVQGTGSGQGELFGRSVDVEGTTTVVGAPLDGLTGSSSEGSVTIYFDAAPVVPPVDPPVDPPAGDTTPPQTSAIAGKAKFKAGKTAKFTFSSNESGSTFECRLGSAPFKSCSSPFSVKTKKLKGKQTLEVRAIDSAGNKDASPTSLKFKVVKKKKAKK